MSDNPGLHEKPKPTTQGVDALRGDAILRVPSRFMFIGATLIVLVVLALGVTGYAEKWLWMRQLDYVGIFWTLLSVRCAMGCLAFVVVFGFLWLNLRQAARNNAALRVKDWPWGPGLALRYDADARAQAELFSKLFKPALVLVSAFIAVLFAVSLSAQWDTYLRFRYGDAFGVVDPLYGVDVGFYVFHLPFYEMLQYSLTTLLVVTLRLI